MKTQSLPGFADYLRQRLGLQGSERLHNAFREPLSNNCVKSYSHNTRPWPKGYVRVDNSIQPSCQLGQPRPC